MAQSNNINARLTGFLSPRANPSKERAKPNQPTSGVLFQSVSSHHNQQSLDEAAKNGPVNGRVLLNPD